METFRICPLEVREDGVNVKSCSCTRRNIPVQSEKRAQLTSSSFLIWRSCGQYDLVWSPSWRFPSASGSVSI